MSALPGWRGGLQTSATEGWSHSHQPSLANRVGNRHSVSASGFAAPTINRPLCNCRECLLQDLRIFVQFPCRPAYALATAAFGLIRAVTTFGCAHGSRSPFMSIIKRCGWLLIWLAGLVLVFAAANKNDPYLIALRGPGNIALAVGSVVVVIVLIRRGCWRRGFAGRLLILLWCLPSLAMLSAHAAFEWRKRARSANRGRGGARSGAALHRRLFVIPGSCGAG